MPPFILLLMLFPSLTLAHFQTLLPTTDTVIETQQSVIQLEMQWTHPMEQGPLMNMGKPQQFGVLLGEQQIDLSKNLVPKQQSGVTFYQASYTFKQPGNYIFFLEPAPYWEETEGKMIVHYTKVIVDAFEAGTGWETLVGLPVEIEPLVRPFGIWVGNLFQGLVRRNGKVVPFAKIEVEYFNQSRSIIPASAALITQVIKADSQGLFSYAIPKTGWWGFAALLESEQPMRNPQGQMVEGELGGVLWVQAKELP